MRSRHITSLYWLALALLACGFASVPAGAAQKTVATAVPLTPQELSELTAHLSGGFSCDLGVTVFPYTPESSRVPVASLDYILPPDDQFYTLLQPPQCTACGNTNSARLSNAHIVLNVLAPCTMPIEYSIVAADTGCTQPDPLALICAPTQTNLVPTSVGLVNFTLPLPDSCQFTGPAFLCITFKSFPVGCDQANNRPRLVLASGGCPACQSFNYFDTDKADLCVEPDALTGQPLFYAEAWSCFTPTLPRTWGALKIRYR